MMELLGLEHHEIVAEDLVQYIKQDLPWLAKRGDVTLAGGGAAGAMSVLGLRARVTLRSGAGAKARTLPALPRGAFAQARDHARGARDATKTAARP